MEKGWVTLHGEGVGHSPWRRGGSLSMEWGWVTLKGEGVGHSPGRRGGSLSMEWGWVTLHGVGVVTLSWGAILHLSQSLSVSLRGFSATLLHIYT